MTPTKEQLTRMYQGPNHNIYTIAWAFGLSKVTITKLLKQYGIPIKPRGNPAWRMYGKGGL